MAKIKTHKATAKRFSLTAGKKLKRRKAGQDHFNSREPGNVTRLKRKDIQADKTISRTIMELMPYKK